MISVKDLDFAYRRDTPILSNIAFDALEGHSISILGNNGSGKTTLIKCLNNILKPQQGVVTLSGTDVSTLGRKTIAKQMAYVTQENAGDQITVFDSVLLGRMPHVRLEPTAEDLAITEQMIKRLGLESFALRHTDELSGGERQKVMLARALAQQPRILLLDEPTSNLDLRNQYESMEIVSSIAREESISVIVVLHDLNLALRYSDRYLFVKDSSVFAYGGQEVMTAENISAVYGMPVKVEEIHGVPFVIPLPNGLPAAV